MWKCHMKMSHEKNHGNLILKYIKHICEILWNSVIAEKEKAEKAEKAGGESEVWRREKIETEGEQELSVAPLLLPKWAAGHRDVCRERTCDGGHRIEGTNQTRMGSQIRIIEMIRIMWRLEWLWMIEIIGISESRSVSYTNRKVKAKSEKNIWAQAFLPDHANGPIFANGPRFNNFVKRKVLSIKKCQKVTKARGWKLGALRQKSRALALSTPCFEGTGHTLAAEISTFSNSGAGLQSVSIQRWRNSGFRKNWDLELNHVCLHMPSTDCNLKSRFTRKLCFLQPRCCPKQAFRLNWYIASALKRAPKAGHKLPSGIKGTRKCKL